MTFWQVSFTALVHTLLACVSCQAATLAPASRIEWEGTSGRTKFNDLPEGTPLSGVLSWDQHVELRLNIDFPSGWTFDGMRSRNGGINPLYYPIFFDGDNFDLVEVQSPTQTLKVRRFSGSISAAGTGAISISDPRTGFVVDIDVSDFSLYESGDSNRDGVFNRLDIVHVLVAGKYLSGEPASWSDGDWTGNGVFDQTDIIRALPYYETGQGGANALAPIREPSTGLLAAFGLVGLALARGFNKRRRACRTLRRTRGTGR